MVIEAEPQLVWFRLPHKKISNHDLVADFRCNKITSKSGETITEKWITDLTGIEYRYQENSLPRLAVPLLSSITARKTLEQKSWAIKEVDFIAAITSFPIGQNLAAYIKKSLAFREGAPLELKADVLEINAACSGFTVFLDYIKKNEANFWHKKILVVVTEQYSPYLHGLDKAIFSDFSIGLAFQYGKELRIIASQLIPEEDHKKLIYMPQPCQHRDKSQVLSYPAPAPQMPKDNELHFGRFFEMQGHEVFRWAVSQVPRAINELITDADLNQKEIKMIIPHQANQRITKSLQKQFSIPVYDNIAQHGNTSSASIPLALAEAINEGKIQEGDKIVLAGFGAGLLICTNIVQIKT